MVASDRNISATKARQGGDGPQDSGAKARLRIPPLAKILDAYEMGRIYGRISAACQARLGQFAEGFPTIGELAEPGVYSAANARSPNHSRDERLVAARDGEV